MHVRSAGNQQPACDPRKRSITQRDHTREFAMETQSLPLVQQSATGDAGNPVVLLVYLIVIVVGITGLWKTFVKAGKPGWASIIPIYNLVVLVEIAGKPTWWAILLFVPIVNLVVFVLVKMDLAKKFNKGPGFALGLILLPFIFYPILGFGDAQYQQAPS
jgi:uncharacterized protein DUF5684